MTICIPYFSTYIKYGSILLLPIAVYLASFDKWFWTFVLLLILFIIWTTNYVTKIKRDTNCIEDFISFFFIPLNRENITFRKIDRIAIGKEQFSKMLNTRSRSRQLNWSEYTAILVYDNDQRFNLITKYDKVEAARAVKDLATYLGIDIIDESSTYPITVDLQKI